MKINELSTQSQRKIIRNVLNAMGYTKYFNSLDVFLNQHYNDQNKCVDGFSDSDYLKDIKAQLAINTSILVTLDSDINTRLSRSDYTYDNYLQYSILTDDQDLARDLISKGANVGEDEVQLAAEYGRSSILKMMLKKDSGFNKDILKSPSSCCSAFWALEQRWHGREVNYPEVKRLLKK